MQNEKILKSSFLGAALGTMIEYYDYALFAMYLPIIAPLFFPADTLYQSLIKGYFILLLTLIARPFGGLFFGYLGDLLGRRVALIASMMGIAIATLLIGLTPSYAVIGVSATIIIVLAKTTQLFCFGGEYNGAGIYVVEHAGQQKEALAGSLLSAMTILGSLIASLLGIILTLDGMPEYSWRIAFILGGLVGVVGLFFRQKLKESPQFKKTDACQHSLIKMIKIYPREMVAGIFVGGFVTVPITSVITFINPFLMVKGYINSHQLMWLQSVLLITAVATLIMVGLIADKKTPLKVMKLACWAMMLLAFPALVLIDLAHWIWIIPASFLLIVINEIFFAPSNALLKNLFAMQYRYRATSVSFGIGMSLWGGLTPLVESALYQWTGYFSSIFLWLFFMSSATLASLHYATRQRKLTEDLNAITSLHINELS